MSAPKTLRLFSNGTTKYSVDLMIHYIDDAKLKSQEFQMSELVNQLEHPYWWETDGITHLAPICVLNNPEKHKHHFERIEAADNRYPIIVEEKEPHYIIDGLHRLSKKYMRGSKTIRAYVIPDDIMEKFIIPETGKPLTRASLETLYRKRFPEFANT